MYYVSSYHLKLDKAQAYKVWLLSPEFKEIAADVERETGLKYVETYWSVLGFGEYEVEDWWELADWAVLDNIRVSEAIMRFFAAAAEIDYADNARSQQTRMVKATSDIRIFEAPKDEE